MGRWTRDELEEAFDAYQKTALAAGMSCNWREWADMFTEDATYVEHHYGEFGGREAIYNWIQKTMEEPINREMKFFPLTGTRSMKTAVGSSPRSGTVCRIPATAAFIRSTTSRFCVMRET